MESLRTAIDTLPTGHGVYFFFDARDRLLYIGKSVNVRARVRSYFRDDGGHTARTARLKHEVVRVESQTCGSELEALLLESRLIKERIPLYNIRGRSYRHFPFVKITQEAFPRVLLTFELRDDGARYYGPFVGEIRVQEALDALRPIFTWRSCMPLARQVCFEHTIGRCQAPCVGLVAESDYGEALEALTAFLSGEVTGPLEALEQDMNRAAESLAFERAAVLRDRLFRLRAWVQQQQAIQAVQTQLDCLVVLPASTPDRVNWLLVRRGRLVHSECEITPQDRGRACKRIRAAMAHPTPSLAVRQSEMEEINIVSGWLHRHTDSERCIRLSGETMKEALTQAWQLSFGAEKQASQRFRSAAMAR
ncbi:MAG: GIY-YIG nuclease family protein [Candidatus Sericytochromatia bacterium]|nr:GIY-YIG nuclease family protein [Candidatus Sericytochromatia bacterium]